MNNDINALNNERGHHLSTEELTNKITARAEYYKQNNISLEEIPCICKHSRVVQDLNEYNDIRIPVSVKQGKSEDIPVSKYVEVLFKCKRKKIYRNDLGLHLYPAQFVIVELENGLDIGTVYSIGSETIDKIDSVYKGVEPDSSVVRIASDADIERNNENIADGYVVMNRAKHLIEQFKLDMKITDAEWQFDHQRLTIYFTAPQRVDFRELVKDLARTFRTRIELRQISSREEAKRIGGIGPCGRYLCCTSFACDFCHVTLDHAKVQQLSNNVTKLSGYCGRLKCCLLYEHETYIEAFKQYPPLQSIVKLPEGHARITKVDIFKEKVHMHISEKNQYLEFTREEVQEMIKNGKVQRPQRSADEKLDAETMHELLELTKEY